MHLPPHPALPPSADLRASKQVPPWTWAQHPQHLCLMVCLMLSCLGSSEQTEVLTLLGALEPLVIHHPQLSQPLPPQECSLSSEAGRAATQPWELGCSFLLGSCPDACTLYPGERLILGWRWLCWVEGACTVQPRTSPFTSLGLFPTGVLRTSAKSCASLPCFLSFWGTRRSELPLTHPKREYDSWVSAVVPCPRILFH